MSLRNILSTPIYIKEFDEDLDIHLGEISKVLSLYKDSMKLTWGDNVYTTFSSNKKLLDELPLLKEYILLNAMQYLTNTKTIYKSISFVESWINCCKQHGFQNYHNHYPADVSGVYYYKTSGNDGNLIFKSASELKYSNIFNKCTLDINVPSEGKLILFPSNIEHCVTMNKTDIDRISIAFNIKVEI